MISPAISSARPALGGVESHDAQRAVVFAGDKVPDDGLPPQINADPVPQDLPRTWDELAPGHLVIAKESLELGWWEAIVLERTGDLVTVKYRDYPQYPPLVRYRSVIALIAAAAA
jgi:hypothetical protein